jgi:hypothetical protein
MGRRHPEVGVVARTEVEFFAGSGAIRSNVGNLLLYMKPHLDPAGSDLRRAMRLAHEVRARRITKGRIDTDSR